MLYAGRLHTGTQDQSSRAQVVALEEGRWSSTVNQNLGTATCSKHRLGSATALTALASCGGLVRLLAALRTSAARTPQFGSALCFRQPVPQSPRSLSLSDHAGTALQLMGKYRESVSHPGLEPQADEQRGPGGPAPHAFGPCLRQEKIYICSRPSYYIYIYAYGTGGAL